MGQRHILHCDCNCFYASVEMQEHPELRGKSIAVCGDPEARHGIVLTASYPAKRMGVKTAMPIWDLGVRQPDVYGRQDLDTLRKLCAEWGKDLGLEVEVRQTDDEAEMVRWMHQAADEKTPVVMNPAAFTHYSYALADAAHMVIDENLPLMEVHISNPSARDEFRKRSVISPVATGTITGMGFYGYKLALDAVAHLLSE